MALALLLLSDGGAAQLPPARTLRAPDAEADEGFTRIRGLRELADGRVLVADVRGPRLVVVDWRTGGLTDIGREGRGPGEWRSTGRLHALGGDSTLLEDSRNARWLLLAGARPVDAYEYAAQRRRPMPTATSADRAGRLLVMLPYAMSRLVSGWQLRVPAYAESLFVVLEHRGNGRRDTVARIRGRSTGVRELRKPIEVGSSQLVTFYVVNPAAAEEQGILYPDGWIALARTDPYRVEWRRPDGRWIRGAPLPFTPVAMDSRERQFAVRQVYPPGSGFRVEDFPPWPRVVPPFPKDALVRLPDGRLAIRRARSARVDRTHYDVIDRAGRLVGRLALSSAEHIVGFGARAVYTVWTDSEDVQWLRRHPWP